MSSMGMINIGVNVNIEDAEQKLAYTEAMMARMQTISMATSAAVNAVKYSTLAGIGAMAALIGPTVLASKVLADFDDNMKRIGAIGGTEFKSNTEEMTKAINELSVQFGASAEDITEVIINYSKAGFTYNETMKMLQPTLELAIANQTELAKASELAMYAFTLWGKEAGMSTYDMLDKMHRAANLSIMDIEDLEHAFAMAGSAASIANISYEQFLALAGGLSMVAAEAGSTVGTLITNFLVRGEEMERVLGVSGIIDNGTMNIQRLIEVMEDASITEGQWAEAFGLWGVRSAKPLMQIRNAATEINTIYSQLMNGQDTLKDGVAEMSVSFERLSASMIQSIWTGIRTTENMTLIREAFMTLNKTLAQSKLGESLGRIIVMSANFLTEYSGKLVGTLENMITSLTRLYPAIYSIGQMFADIAKIVSAVPSEILKFLAMLAIMNKIVPMTTVIIPALSKQLLILTGNLDLATMKGLQFDVTMKTMLTNFKSLLAGVGILVTGLFLAQTATSGLDKAIATLAITIGMLIPLLWTLNLLQVALTPTKVLASLAAMGALAAGMTFWMSSGNNQTPVANVANAPYSPGVGSTYNNNTYYNNFYGVDTNEIKSYDILGVQSG